MANWAALQEQLTGLPVAKRAKYGIHFQKGSEIEAHFVGKPCHFQENGIWKPIDTALLATADGWYSSPHSDVVIHPDGRVRVKGSTYQQFTELPSAKTGKLVGDKIIRTFPGGEQWLIMKEDGFREEIHVNKQKIPVEKFIAKTMGNLPSKYKAHPITAEDADGNVYEFKGDVAEFGTWLDKASYPVVIDPDISVNTGVGGDTYVHSGVSTYNFGAQASITLVPTTVKGLIRFDLSSIDSGSVCTAATLKAILAYASTGGSPATFSAYKITNANGDWIEGNKSYALAGSGEPCWNAKAADGSGGVTTAWAGSTGLSTAGTDYIDTVIAEVTMATRTAGEACDLVFNASGLAVLQDWFGDATNNGLLVKITGYRTDWHSGEASVASNRPILSVTYGAAGVPKQFMHYQRLRSL